jgi:hypothetical protein
MQLQVMGSPLMIPQLWLLVLVQYLLMASQFVELAMPLLVAIQRQGRETFLLVAK